ncbi:hypothetical protein TcCL_ESM07347, partial [Trypanosoma cruzi]
DAASALVPAPPAQQSRTPPHPLGHGDFPSPARIRRRTWVHAMLGLVSSLQITPPPRGCAEIQSSSSQISVKPRVAGTKKQIHSLSVFQKRGEKWCNNCTMLSLLLCCVPRVRGRRAM